MFRRVVSTFFITCCPLHLGLHTIKHGHLEFFGHLGALCVVFEEEVAHHVCVVELGFGGGSEPQFFIQALGAVYAPAAIFFLVEGPVGVVGGYAYGVYQLGGHAHFKQMVGVVYVGLL